MYRVFVYVLLEKSFAIFPRWQNHCPSPCMFQHFIVRRLDGVKTRNRVSAHQMCSDFRSTHSMPCFCRNLPQPRENVLALQEIDQSTIICRACPEMTVEKYVTSPNTSENNFKVEPGSRVELYDDATTTRRKASESFAPNHSTTYCRYS